MLVRKALIAPIATIADPQAGKYCFAASAIADFETANVSAGKTPKATKDIMKNITTETNTPLMKTLGSVVVGFFVSPAT